MITPRFLKRHPVPMRAHFEHVLVLTYALPASCLRPLLPPGLAVDTYEEFGFLAIAMVQTRKMRPAFAPSLVGGDFFLTGYRIFTRFRTPSGRTLRGLRILRSDSDSDRMVRWGNRLTHYNYRRAQVDAVRRGNLLEIGIRTPDQEADLRVRAYLSSDPAPLPVGSPFPDARIARKFAGPLPFTFDYEAESNSIIRVEGVRQAWDPKPTRVEVLRNTFLDREPFASANPVLASAFHIENVPYRWRRGVRESATV
jgi:Uncharacterized conserved protein (COG2071)